MTAELDDGLYRPYRLTTTSALGDVILVSDPETRSGANWIALGD